MVDNRITAGRGEYAGSDLPAGIAIDTARVDEEFSFGIAGEALVDIGHGGWMRTAEEWIWPKQLELLVPEFSNNL
jgi:hypothetical protein